MSDFEPDAPLTDTREKWMEWFASLTDQSPSGLAKAMLHNLEGYGFEYGYDEDDDAVNLLELIYWHDEYMKLKKPTG